MSSEHINTDFLKDNNLHIIKDYELEFELGSGKFGKVFLAHKIDNMQQKVAIKIILKNSVLKYNTNKYIQTEIKILQQVKHPNIIKFIEYINLPSAHIYIMEYAPCGDLFKNIFELKSFDKNKAKKYFLQIIAAVSYLHSINIIHRDIKLENILLIDDNIKICDFGCSKFINEKNYKPGYILHMTHLGTIAYAAPEILQKKFYDGKFSDIWSCGVILYTMLCGYLPFNYNKDVINNIINGKYRNEKIHLSDDAEDLISKILVIDPKKRYYINDIINHRWIKNNNKQEPYNNENNLNIMNSFIFDSYLEFEIQTNNKCKKTYFCC